MRGKILDACYGGTNSPGNTFVRDDSPFLILKRESGLTGSPIVYTVGNPWIPRFEPGSPLDPHRIPTWIPLFLTRSAIPGSPADQPTTDRSPADRPTDRPTARRPTDRPSADPRTDRQPIDRPPTDRPPTDQSPTDRLRTDRPPTDRTSARRPTAGRPPTDRAPDLPPAADRPTAERPTACSPIAIGLVE